MSEVLGAANGDQTDTDALVSGDRLVYEGVEELTYSELFGRYQTSEFGLFQDGQPLRYAQRYAYDPTVMLEDLGDDIHPVRHMQFTEESIFRRLALQQQIAGAEKFSPLEVVAGRVGALLHDTGECEHPDLVTVCGETVGDIAYDLKTDEHEAAEEKIRAHIYEVLYPDLPDELLQTSEDMIRNSSGSFLNFGFHIVEYIGYLQTTTRAGEIALSLIGTEDQDTDRFAQLRQLAVDGASKHFSYLEAQGADFPYTRTVLSRLEKQIDAIQSYLTQ